jgi:alpha-galactosidase
MPRSAASLAHERAGRAELESIGLRVPEATAGAATLVQRDFAIGTTSIGALELEVAAETHGSTACVHLRARNPGPLPVRLDGVVLALRWTGLPARSLRYLRHGWQSWSFTGSRPLGAEGDPPFPSGAWLRSLHHGVAEVPRDRIGWHESELVGVVGSAGGGPVLLAGVYERGVSFAIVYARATGSDVEVAVELRVDGAIAPGETLRLETLRIALGTDASALLEDYALDYGRRTGARVARPFVAGWCSWYYAFQHVSEADVLRNVEALAKARHDIPVEVVQIDDGYQRAIGDWRETNSRFPRGLAALAAEIRAAGFVPGLWTAPFCVVPESELFATRPQWLLRDGGAPSLALHHPDWSAGGRVHALDTSRDDVVDHLERLFADLVGMGFLYQKLDFLFVEAQPATASDPALGRAARLRRGLEAIRRGAGEEAFLLGCGCPLGAAVGVVDGMRIGPDVAPCWWPDPAVRVPGIEETQPSTRSAIRSVLARAFMHRRLWLNDPDCLMVRSRDTGLAACEREALASAIAASGGMCIVSDDVPGLAPGDRELLGAALALAARIDGSGIPGGARVPDLLAAEIPGRIVAEDAGAGCFTGLVNAGEEAIACELPGSSARIGPVAGDRIELPPHGGALRHTRRAVDLAVFCDFDGTFSVQDVGATLAERHAADRRPVQWARYERGEITPWEYNLAVLDGMRLTVEELERFLQGVQLDAGAHDLLAWCAREGVPFRVVSDGFDWNLNRIQVLQGVRFAYHANHLRVEGGRWRIRAGHPNPACSCGTGTCKAGVIEAFRREHPAATLVHVGNGRVSDTCGALAADVAFAKDSLAVELARRGAPFTPFATLRDVIPALDRLRAGARPSR